MCSYDQLVLGHRVDPEQVLINLGFVKPWTCQVRRIPDQFLLYESRAHGITCDEYLDDNPLVKQQLEQKLARQNAFRVVNRVLSPTSGQADDDEQCPAGESLDFVGCLIVIIIIIIVCRRAPGRSARHHSLNDLIARSFASAGVPVTK